jgi:hypothetical protein
MPSYTRGSGLVQCFLAKALLIFDSLVFVLLRANFLRHTSRLRAYGDAMFGRSVSSVCKSITASRRILVGILVYKHSGFHGTPHAA